MLNDYKNRVPSRLGGSQTEQNIVSINNGSGKNENGPANKPDNGPNGGGHIGQVPQTVEGRIMDAQDFNTKYIPEAIRLGVKKGLLPPNFQLMDNPITKEDIENHKIIAQFTLAADSYTNNLSYNYVIPPPHLETTKISPPLQRSKLIEDNPLDREESCSSMVRKQQKRVITLRWSNLRTLFPKRWLDSVVIDAQMHVLQEPWPLKNYLYINSAESDPTIEEIRKTPGCLDFFNNPLWLNSHWTVILGNSRRKRLRYLNSQVVDRQTPLVQTKPFKEVFPGYDIVIKNPPQQINGWDCGVYVLYYTHILMYYKEEEIDNVTPEDVTEYRHNVLIQLILWYYLIPLSRRMI